MRVLFGPEQTAKFAALSGDFNPLHIDPVAARRYQFGGPVVHGMHSLLWALNEVAGRIGGSLRWTDLNATFHYPVLIGQEATLEIERSPQDATQIKVFSQGKLAMEAVVSFTQDIEGFQQQAIEDHSYEPHAADVLHADQIADQKGALPLICAQKLLSDLFPKLQAFAPMDQNALILASTRVVGMKCPGLHSLYCALKLRFDGPLAAELTYDVSKFRPRHRTLNLQISSGAARGEIVCMLRPQPFEQACYTEVAAQVRPDEFGNMKALIVGGSRGLGELVCKLVAAGGGQPRLTYNSGRADAERVCSDIQAGGGTCEALQLSINDMDKVTLKKAVAGRTHLFYFATPPIQPEGRQHVSEERLLRYITFYVTAFRKITEAFVSQGGHTALQPSTVFLDTLPDTFMSYTMAKSAAEVLCATYDARAEFICASPRLPALETDQTQGLAMSSARNAVAVLADALRAIQKVSD